MITKSSGGLMAFMNLSAAQREEVLSRLRKLVEKDPEEANKPAVLLGNHELSAKDMLLEMESGTKLGRGMLSCFWKFFHREEARDCGTLTEQS